jgi:signal transduction histidine kinase
VLIVSDDPEFVSSLMLSCHGWSIAPEFAVASQADSGELPECIVAIVDGAEALSRLHASVLLAIAVLPDECLLATGTPGMRILQLPRGNGWADTAAAVAEQTMLRGEAVAKFAESERRMRECERFATLGRFIVEARHGLGNALTSLLGHSELALMKTESNVRDEVRGQLETIHAMSLRISDVMQRLTTLDMEMRLAERQTRTDPLCSPAEAAGHR